MSNVKVVSCNCKSDYQDHVYGGGKRVANLTASGTRECPVYRCTVCGVTTGKKK